MCSWVPANPYSNYDTPNYSQNKSQKEDLDMIQRAGLDHKPRAARERCRARLRPSTRSMSGPDFPYSSCALGVSFFFFILVFIYSTLFITFLIITLIITIDIAIRA